MRKRWMSDEGGSSLVEMALVSLFLIMLLAGAIDFGWAFHDFIILQNASREGARVAARLPCKNDDLTQRTFLRDAIVTAARSEVTQSGIDGIDITVTITPNPVSSTCPAAGAPFTVAVRYNYATTLGGILGLGAIPMQAQTRMAFFGNDQ